MICGVSSRLFLGQRNRPARVADRRLPFALSSKLWSIWPRPAVSGRRCRAKPMRRLRPFTASSASGSKPVSSSAPGKSCSTTMMNNLASSGSGKPSTGLSPNPRWAGQRPGQVRLIAANREPNGRCCVTSAARRFP